MAEWFAPQTLQQPFTKKCNSFPPPLVRLQLSRRIFFTKQIFPNPEQIFPNPEQIFTNPEQIFTICAEKVCYKVCNMYYKLCNMY